ncbi:MAG: EAL domain-containing protein [Bacilli bacterium]|nr:EAL domain-containing protein [Bacilli bacterium]
MKYKAKITEDLHKRINPFRSTISIIILYAIIGMAWIFLSDLTLSWIVQDPEVVEELQLAKGIFYVVITAILFYFIIKKRIDLYFDVIANLKDTIVQLEHLEQKLYQLAYFDTLTGLMSKNKMIEKVDEFIQFNPDRIIGLVYIDIDDFKNINELKGHEIGDQLIQLIAEEIKKIALPPNEVARLGGDEFIILINNIQKQEDIIDLVREHASSIQKLFDLGNDRFYVTVSAGMAFYPTDGNSFETLFKNADIALHNAKKNGKGQIVLYNKEFEAEVFKQSELSFLLHQAIRNKELELYYQPLLHLKKAHHLTVEALLRWHHPEKGFIPPLEFIPIAELSNQIKEITLFVFEQCFIQFLKWEKIGIHTSISINLSTKLIGDNQFFQQITAMIDQYQITPRHFIIEVTESVILNHMEESIERLLAWKKLGFQLALDDFGTGYSSLTYLQKLPFDIIKIDRSFIKDFTNAKNDETLFMFMINLVHHINKEIVFEGVEEVNQRELLEKYGADYIQGYCYAKPMPVSNVETFFKKDIK